MASFMKNLKKAAHSACNPNELKNLDSLVEKLQKKYDSWLAAYSNDGTPPNKEQAAVEEQTQFSALNIEYDREAENICDRKPTSNDDNISVRKRQLNRGLDSRRGKLFGKFSSEVASLTELAANTLRTAIATSDDFDDVVRKQFPMPEALLVQEFENMKITIEAQIDLSFPGQSEGLDNYDDALPDGIYSYKDLKARWPGILDTCIAENRSKIADTMAEIRAQAAASLREEVMAILDKQRTENAALSFVWLPTDQMEVLRGELDELTYQYGIPRE